MISGTNENKSKKKIVIASLSCHGNSDVNKTNNRLTFLNNTATDILFPGFVNADVVNA